MLGLRCLIETSAADVLHHIHQSIFATEENCGNANNLYPNSLRQSNHGDALQSSRHDLRVLQPICLAQSSHTTVSLGSPYNSKTVTKKCCGALCYRHSASVSPPGSRSADMVDKLVQLLGRPPLLCRVSCMPAMNCFHCANLHRSGKYLATLRQLCHVLAECRCT